MSNTGLGHGSYGAKLPAIYFYPDVGMEIAAAISGDDNYLYQGEKPAENMWTKIKISQKLEGNAYIHR